MTLLLGHAAHRDCHQHGAARPLLKAGAGAADFIAQLFDWRTLLGFCLYGGSALLYIVALRRIPMSRALPCTAISYVAAALIGHYAFAEPMGGMQIGAIALICCGVVLLALADVGKRRVERSETHHTELPSHRWRRTEQPNRSCVRAVHRRSAP